MRLPRSTGGLSLVLWVLLLAGTAVAVVAVVALVLGALGRPRDERGGEPGPDGVHGAHGASLLPSPRAAAAAGRLDEAVHLLLLHAIERLARRTALFPGAAETTRELVRRIPLDGEPRAALAALAHDVEFIHFGGRPATAAGFDRCARNYRLAVGEDAP